MKRQQEFLRIIHSFQALYPGKQTTYRCDQEAFNDLRGSIEIDLSYNQVDEEQSSKTVHSIGSNRKKFSKYLFSRS